MAEYMPAIDDYLSFQAATVQVVAAERIIQNVPDVGVVFWFHAPRVNIHDVRVIEV
jgi:hypothetical protein